MSQWGSKIPQIFTKLIQNALKWSKNCKIGANPGKWTKNVQKWVTIGLKWTKIIGDGHKWAQNEGINLCLYISFVLT